MGGLRRASVVVSLLLAGAMAGCGGGQAATSEPGAQDRLASLYQLYKLYCEKNKRGPVNEQDLRSFAQKLTPDERASRKIGDDVEALFKSPRDGQNFVIKYNLMISAGGGSKGVAWEAVGKDGRKYVALMRGYVEECNETMFQEVTK
jgi:hypothetical protein